MSIFYKNTLKIDGYVKYRNYTTCLIIIFTFILKVEANARSIDLASLPAAVRSRITVMTVLNEKESVQQTMSI